MTLKETCELILKLDKEATSAPWDPYVCTETNNDGPDSCRASAPESYTCKTYSKSGIGDDTPEAIADACLIANYRNEAPKLAQCLLEIIQIAGSTNSPCAAGALIKNYLFRHEGSNEQA